MVMAKGKQVFQAELARITQLRDSHRVKAIEHTEIAAKFDKQVNRLSHFISEYDVAEGLDEPVKKPISRRMGMTNHVINMIQSNYPNTVYRSTVLREIKEMGLNPNSVTSCIERLVDKGIISKAIDGEGKANYLFVVSHRSLDVKRAKATV